MIKNISDLKVIGYITLLAATAGFGVTHASTPAPKPAPTKVYQLGPCKYEDSNNCYWDAKARGNHKGTSFITLNGKTYYAK